VPISLVLDFTEREARIMSGKFSKLLLVLILGSIAASAAEDGSAKAILNNARERANLSENGAKPYRMSISFRAFHLKAGDIDGKYTLFWNSDDQSRSESKLGDFREIKVNLPAETWIKSNMAFAPASIETVRLMIRQFQDLGGTSDLTHFGKVRSEKVDEIPAQCFDANNKYHRYRMCFSAADGALLRVEDRSDTSKSVYEYSDYNQVGSKRYPRRMSLWESGQKMVEATIDSVQEWAPAGDELKPPPGSVAYRVCKSGRATPPKATYTPDPLYPEDIKVRRNSMVVLRVRLSPQGKISALEVHRSGGPEFDREAIRAVSQWKFEPAKCAGEPIPVEINIEVNIRLY